MRVISWNCNMAFRKKAHKALSLSPDILVVSECESPPKQHFPSEIRLPHSRLWVGDNPNKGLGVFSYTGFELTIHEAYDPSLKYIVPVKVSNDRGQFTLLAVWAMGNDADWGKRYIGKVWLAVNQYAALLSGPVLIAGDFNWNVIWDNYPGLYGNLSHTVQLLASKGVVSLYHHVFGESFGQESSPTWYMYRKQTKPFHIDYIFASRHFLRGSTALEVGSHAEWSGLSDHMPLIATFHE